MVSVVEFLPELQMALTLLLTLASLHVLPSWAQTGSVILSEHWLIKLVTSA